MSPSALVCQEATVSSMANGSNRRSKENRRNSVSPTTSNSAGVLRMIGLRLTGSTRRWRTRTAPGSASPAAGSRERAATILALAAGESFGAARARSLASPAASSPRRIARLSFTGRSIQTAPSSSARGGGTKATSRPLAKARTAFPHRPSSARVVTPSGSASGRRLQPTTASKANTIPIATRVPADNLPPPPPGALTPGNGAPSSRASSADSAG